MLGDGASITGRGLSDDATEVRNGGFTEGVSSKSTDVKTDQAGDRTLSLGAPSYSDNSARAALTRRPADAYDAGQTGTGDSLGRRRRPSASTRQTPSAASRSPPPTATTFRPSAWRPVVPSVPLCQLAGAIQVINVDTLARVGVASKINVLGGAGTLQDVLVASGNDFRSLNVGASAAVAGAVSIAPSASVQIVNLASQAIVERTSTINATPLGHRRSHGLREDHGRLGGARRRRLCRRRAGAERAGAEQQGQR